MFGPPLLAAALLALVPRAVAPLAATPDAQAGHSDDRNVRLSTFNASLNRATAGQLVSDLSTPGNG